MYTKQNESYFTNSITVLLAYYTYNKKMLKQPPF